MAEREAKEEKTITPTAKRPGEVESPGLFAVWMKMLRVDAVALGNGLAFGSEILVHRFCGLSAFCDGPHHERLAAPHVAGCEDILDRTLEVRGRHVAPCVECEAELLDHAVTHRSEKAHGEQHKIDIHGELGARDLFELWRRAHAKAMELLDITLLVAGEAEGVDAPIADAAFFVRAFGAELQRPQRPWR